MRAPLLFFLIAGFQLQLGLLGVVWKPGVSPLRHYDERPLVNIVSNFETFLDMDVRLRVGCGFIFNGCAITQSLTKGTYVDEVLITNLQPSVYFPGLSGNATYRKESNHIIIKRQKILFDRKVYNAYANLKMNIRSRKCSSVSKVDRYLSPSIVGNLSESCLAKVNVWTYLKLSNLFGMRQGSLGSVRPSFRFLGSIASVQRGLDRGDKRATTDEDSKSSEYNLPKAPFGGIVSSVRGLPLSTKIGGSIIFTISAAYVWFIGAKRSYDRRHCGFCTLFASLLGGWLLALTAIGLLGLSGAY